MKQIIATLRAAVDELEQRWTQMEEVREAKIDEATHPITTEPVEPAAELPENEK